MSSLAARIISTIFHPLLVPTYGLLILINLNTHSILMINEEYRYYIVAFVFISTFFIPTLIILIMKKIGVVHSLEMHTQKERVFPILMVAIAFYITYYFLKRVGLTGLITLFMVGSTMLVLITLLINYITKISLHLTAWAGLLGALTGFAIRFNYNLTLIIFSLILLTGIIASARLKLNAHNPLQIYLGFVLGMLGMMSLFFFV